MKIKEIINLTPHDIVVFTDKDELTFKSQGVLRVAENRTIFDETEDGIKIFTKSFGVSSQLPLKKPGVLYIVSVPVAQSHLERDDFMISDDIVRDNVTGKIIGCKSFAVLKKGE